MTVPTTATDQLPRGREDDYVLMGTTGPGWKIHKGSIDDGTTHTQRKHASPAMTGDA